MVDYALLYYSRRFSNEMCPRNEIQNGGHWQLISIYGSNYDYEPASEDVHIEFQQNWQTKVIFGSPKILSKFDNDTLYALYMRVLSYDNVT